MNKSIRVKIMSLLFYSVLISSLVIGMLGIMLTSNVIKDSSTENMRLLCKNNADKIDITLAKVEESVNTLVHFVESELPSIESLKDQQFRKEFSASVQKNALHHVESVEGAAAVYLHYDPEYVGGTDGFFYVKEKTNDKFKYHPLTEISAYPDNDSEHVGWWYIPTNNRTATWVEAYYDANIGRYVISYVVPMYKNEQLIGVIGVDVFTEHIEELVKEVTIFNSGQGAVLKSDGTVLYHPNFNRGELIGEGDPGFAGVIEKLTKEDTTKELISYKLKGEKKKLASCKLRNGMLMICFAPEAEIYKQQTNLMVTSGIITGVVIILALLCAALVSSRLARPIKKLNEAAKHLTDGEFDLDIKAVTDDEIGELTQTFIEMREILKKQINMLNIEAHVDGLTGVGNKSAYVDREEELNKAIASGNAGFSVAVFDVNKLKVANDVFGHMAGDGLLLTVAEHLASVFDASNVYRMGGDEFVVIMPEKDGVNFPEKVENCVSAMQNLSVKDYPECKVSCAYGYSEFNKAMDTTLSDVLHRADKKMYKNKTETKKITYPWQEGAKGIKQLQIEKYSELLQHLKGSTDDYLFLMNLESGVLRFFGGNDNFYELANESNPEEGISGILDYVHVNDRNLVKSAISDIMNRETESIDINFRMVRENIQRWVNCRGNVIKDETDSHFVLTGRISQNAVKHLYNPITTLYNKVQLKANLQSDVIEKFSHLVLIDIDNLSEINLTHGSKYGEELLKLLAKELENRFSMWQIYHVEKDRFVVLFNVASTQEIEKVFEEIKEIMSVKCSVSAAVVPNDGSAYVNADNIYDNAVQLIVSSKESGIGKISIFTKEVLLERISAVELLEEIEESVKNYCEGFYLVYQPQINAEDYSIISAEALLRFESKTRGQIYPDQFIPILEQTGLINEVGLWVTDKALEQCKVWRTYNPDFKVSVNVSPKQLKNKNLASQIIALLKQHNLQGNALILEITESTQLDESTEVFDTLTQLQQYEIQIAIDDFGTGYSNLGNLKHINADVLKIDRAFVQDIKEDGYNYRLIYNVLEFARSNALKVCLEGVETKEELLVLSKLHPDTFQGYLFDRPCSAQNIESKYFKKETEEYNNRVDYIDHLSREKKHSPIVNMKMKTILLGLDIGLWILNINKKTGERALYADETMRKLLGFENINVSPEDCYVRWYNNVADEHRQVIDKMIADMETKESVVQAKYLWNHSSRGQILVRASGRCSSKTDDIVVFEGFHRVISDIEENV